MFLGGTPLPEFWHNNNWKRGSWRGNPGVTPDQRETTLRGAHHSLISTPVKAPGSEGTPSPTIHPLERLGTEEKNARSETLTHKNPFTLVDILLLRFCACFATFWHLPFLDLKYISTLDLFYSALAFAIFEPKVY